MKKHGFILLLTALLLICACVPTPEKEIVVQKDFDHMIEKAKETPVSDTVVLEDGTQGSGVPTASPQNTDAPRYAHITESFTGRTDAFRVEIDADVIVPDGPLPIVRVKPDEFNAEKAQPYFDALCSGEDYYPREELETKENLERQIAEMQAEVDAGLPSMDRDGLSEKDVQKEIKNWKSQIKELQERWKVAKDKPENPMRVLADYDWSKVPSYYPLGVWTTDEQAQFTFRLDGEQEQNGHKIRFVQSSVLFEDARKEPKTKARHQFEYYRDVTGQTTIPTGTKLTKTPLEAQTEAEQLIQRIGAKDMAVDRVYLMRECVLNEGNEGYCINYLLPEDYEYQYLYEVRFCRTVNGIPVVKPTFFASSSNNSENGAYAPSWEYEELYVRVSSDGVCELYHLAPIETVTTLVEDAKLLPFSDILDIAKKMLPILHEDQIGSGNRVEFRIDRITLSLQRIAEQDNLEYGLLVPTWNFWGVDLRIGEDGVPHTYLCGVFSAGTCGYLPLLSINAIDGTIIDATKGY
ncbi:MAG: hypothetical protein IJK88_08125 [Clostridia bacterium]|nr:hypothetical protein [Clostridia bacterium]